MDKTAGKGLEPFVDADRAAQFLVITRRRLLEMARAGEIPGHGLGQGKRKIWRFRLSELAEAVVAKSAAANSNNGVRSSPAVPGNRIGGNK
jgi:Helix-turn-helix domain